MVSVRLRSAAPKVQTVITDAQGRYVLRDIRAGIYSLEASLPGHLSAYVYPILIANETDKLTDMSVILPAGGPPVVGDLTFGGHSVLVGVVMDGSQ